MKQAAFEAFFGKIAAIFTLESLAEAGEAPGGFVRQDPRTSIWDALDRVEVRGQEYIDIGRGRRVPCLHFFRKPMRVLFYIILVEFEGRLFRIEEWRGRDITDLNEGHLNEFIKDVGASDLMALQSEYVSSAKFKEDLKTLAAFRNLIMHTNKKLEREVPLEIIVKRKRQATKILLALEQVLGGMQKPENRK